MSVTISQMQPTARFNLRIAAENRAVASKALGCELPDNIGAIAARKNIRAICLGPDEWQLDAPGGEAATVQSAFAAIYQKTPHSLTDISDREITFCLEGPQAMDLLTVGCPRDLRGLAAGSGARTVFDTVQAVLIREAAERFTLSVWRSFAPHVAELLSMARTELATGL